MTILKSRIALAVLSVAAFANASFAQQGTLEMTSLGSSNIAVGPSTTPVVVNFREDIANLTSGTQFKTYTPALSVSTYFADQQFNTSYNNISTGIVFGGGNTGSTGGSTQQSAVNPIYNVLGSSLVQPPQNGMFVSSPTGTIVSNYQLGGRGVGQDPEATQFGVDIDNGFADDYNFGMAVFTNVEPLFDANLDKAGRYYYGQIIFKFSRPVINPVLHIGGLGGSYNFQPIGGGPRKISYFSTEMELQNAAGITSTFMAGNENFIISGNKILNGSATPNGGSFDDGTTQGGFLTYGAATGSVRINGVVSQLIYNVYVKGSAASDFNFSQPQAAISGATRRPLNGDLFYIGVSLNKPTQQISGNVFLDKDGLTDNNINKSFGIDNAKENIGGSLFANLLNAAGQVVASTQVTQEGSYLFDNVPVGTYSVQLTTNAGAGTYASPTTAPATVLPTGWINTGEFIGNTSGNDGTVNGKSSSVIVAANDIKVEVNFGIERIPNSDSYNTGIPTPSLNSVITLIPTNVMPGNPVPVLAPLPVLTGADPEDQPTSATLLNKAVQITTLPTNSQLLYNNSPVFAGQTIPNYNPALLQIKFTIATATGETSFQYAYVDAAGIPDPTPASYRIFWPSSGPLPIVLEEFTAVKNNCNANLVWKTASELNSDRFEVEVSSAAGNVFTKIGTIAANGNTNSPKTYQFNFAMESGVVYYFRLKMFNKDGSYSYTIIQKLSCDDASHDISIRPNPTVDVFTIKGMLKGKNNITLFSNDGKLVKTQVITNTIGDVNISNLTPGVYVLKIQNENGSVEVRRIVKN